VKRSLIAALVVGACTGGAVPARAQAPAQAPTQATAAAPANLDEYVKLVRSGVQQDKSQILGQALELDATQSAAFWPVYKQYEAELTAIGDKRYAGIKEYAAHYGTLTDAKASELTDGAIALEEQRLALLKRYVGQLRAVLPPVKVARFYQVENALNKIVDLRLVSEIPLAK
jgi:hypothetical protein